MNTIDWTKPIDSDVKGTTKKLIEGTPDISGGDNCLCLRDTEWWKIKGGLLSKPKGVPGDSNHPISIIRSHHIAFTYQRHLDFDQEGRVRIVTSGSDGVNVWNSDNVLLEFLLFFGLLFTGKEEESNGDIGRDICFDGTGKGGIRNIARNLKCRSITVAAGQVTLGPHLHCDNIQIGGGYGEDDLTREPHIQVTLIDVPKSCVWIHKLCKGNVRFK